MLVAALVLASVAALFLNQRTRREGLVLDAIHVTPIFMPGGDPGKATITFRIKGPDQVDLDVIDADDGRAVRRLATGRALPDRVETGFAWDGRTDDGSIAPPGVYTLRVHERRRDRTITPGETILLLPQGPGR